MELADKKKQAEYEKGIIAVIRSYRKEGKDDHTIAEFIKDSLVLRKIRWESLWQEPKGSIMIDKLMEIADSGLKRKYYRLLLVWFVYTVKKEKTIIQ